MTSTLEFRWFIDSLGRKELQQLQITSTGSKQWSSIKTYTEEVIGDGFCEIEIQEEEDGKFNR